MAYSVDPDLFIKKSRNVKQYIFALPYCDLDMKMCEQSFIAISKNYGRTVCSDQLHYTESFLFMIPWSQYD